MCPGGTVVNAASEEGGIVVNGMSEYGRDAENSNSALLVGIEPENFGSDHPLAGMDMQRKIEHAAFLAGGSDYTAPAQLVGDFLVCQPFHNAHTNLFLALAEILVFCRLVFVGVLAEKFGYLGGDLLHVVVDGEAVVVVFQHSRVNHRAKQRHKLH